MFLVVSAFSQCSLHVEPDIAILIVLHCFNFVHWLGLSVVQTSSSCIKGLFSKILLLLYFFYIVWLSLCRYVPSQVFFDIWLRMIHDFPFSHSVYHLLKACTRSVSSFWTSRWIKNTYTPSGIKVQYNCHINTDQTIPLCITLDSVFVSLCWACIPLLFLTALSSLWSLHCATFWLLLCHWKCPLPALCPHFLWGVF